MSPVQKRGQPLIPVTETLSAEVWLFFSEKAVQVHGCRGEAELLRGIGDRLVIVADDEGDVDEGLNRGIHQSIRRACSHSCVFHAAIGTQTFGIDVDRLVIDPLKAELEALGIDPTIVDKHRPSFCAIDTFEMAANVCNIVGPALVLQQKTQGEYLQWALETFLMNNFKKELESRPASAFSEQWLKLMRRG